MPTPAPARGAIETPAPVAAASAERPLAPTPATEPEAAAPAPAVEPPAANVAAGKPDILEDLLPPTEPARESPVPAPVPEEPEMPPEPGPRKPESKQVEENLFDEAADEPEEEPESEGHAARNRQAPAPEPIVEETPIAEDLFQEPESRAPASDAMPSPPDEAPGEEPTDRPAEDPFSALDAEPVRRWIDASGRHETIGRLVEVRPDRVRILKPNGRCTTVPTEQLSRHDRAYVTAVGDRLAGRAPPLPSVTATARR